MRSTILAIFAALSVASIPVPAGAQKRGDQMQAYQARKQGKLLPLPEIERRVVPQMNGAEYLGFDFDGGSGVYTLKFLRDGTVIWVDVDGRSGQVIGRTGR
ncbi:hypothetical protein ASG67_12810 [Sphingomonas sp. Leaf339]|nr:hypothetical protein ASG67_12810 [Sphingomonas sp. Leaf339]